MLRIMNYILLPRLWLARHVQNQSRITPMRRICSSLIFVFMWIDMRLYGALIFTDFHYSMDYLRIISCWGISSAVQAQEKIRKKQDQVYLRFRKSVKKIKSVASVLSVSHFERVRTEPKAKEHYNVVLSSRQPISACL